jgi:competence protein ComEC
MSGFLFANFMGGIHKSKKYFWCGAGFIVGVGLFSGFGFSLMQWWLFGFLGFLFWQRTRFFIVGIIGGILYFVWYTSSGGVSVMALYEQKIEFQGRIIAEVDQRIDHTKLTLGEISADGQLYNGRILIKAQRLPVYQYGDTLQVVCKLQAPAVFQEFNYQNYLYRYHVDTVCYYPVIKLLKRVETVTLFGQLLELKYFIKRRTGQLVHEPYASFLAGLLIGDRAGIDPDLMEAFNRTGTTHIIAVSGYNVSLVLLYALQACYLFGLQRRHAFGLLLICLMLFVIICGASSAVIRAAVMGGLVLFAQHIGRRVHMANLLITAVVVMQIGNPKILFYDIGFQLSTVATIGLIYVTPFFEKRFEWLPERFEFRESFIATLVATLVTLPFIIWYFGRISLVALIVNILIAPLIPLAMAVGAVMLCASFISIELAQVCGYFVALFLEIIIQMVSWFAQIPWASVSI